MAAMALAAVSEDISGAEARTIDMPANAHAKASPVPPAISPTPDPSAAAEDDNTIAAIAEWVFMVSKRVVLKGEGHTPATGPPLRIGHVTAQSQEATNLNCPNG
jgi:hypothetical protein